MNATWSGTNDDERRQFLENIRTVFRATHGRVANDQRRNVYPPFFMMAFKTVGDVVFGSVLYRRNAFQSDCDHSVCSHCLADVYDASVVNGLLIIGVRLMRDLKPRRGTWAVMRATIEAKVPGVLLADDALSRVANGLELVQSDCSTPCFVHRHIRLRLEPKSDVIKTSVGSTSVLPFKGGSVLPHAKGYSFSDVAWDVPLLDYIDSDLTCPLV